MTIFGPDISSYQRGLNLASLANASFVIAKTTEGTYYTDPDYDGWRLQSAALHKPFIWYHFLSGEAASAQAAHTAAKVGDKNLPGMLDFEPTPTFRPTLAQAIAYVDAAHAAGLNLRLVYLPRWYWQQIGSPDLGALRDRGLQLVSSAYPGGSGSAPAIYPGDKATGWGPYGGMTPLLYQFTDKASDGGQPLDYNAFQGDVAAFEAALAIPQAPQVPTPTTNPADPEDDMPAFATGPIPTGDGAKTVIGLPPANAGTAGWGNVWFTLACDWAADGVAAHVRVAAWVHGEGWSHIVENFAVPQYGDRVNPFGGPLPTGVQKVSVERLDSPDAPLAYLIEAAHR